MAISKMSSEDWGIVAFYYADVADQIFEDTLTGETSDPPSPAPLSGLRGAPAHDSKHGRELVRHR